MVIILQCFNLSNLRWSKGAAYDKYMRRVMCDFNKYE